MEEQLTRIGILQPAGIAGTIIEQAFVMPEMAEVAELTIYSKENKNDKNVSNDLRFGNIDAAVVAPGGTSEPRFDSAVTVCVDDRQRLATLMPSATRAELVTSLTKEAMVEKLLLFLTILKRDFRITMPRIAVLALNDTLDETEKNIIEPAIKEVAENRIGVFGPYTFDSFVEGSLWHSFDLVVAIDDARAEQMLAEMMPEVYTRVLTNIPAVFTLCGMPADINIEENMHVAVEALQKAVFTAVDVIRNRQAYDEGHANPLPKLYHERRDESEKIRFAIPKKKSEQAE